MRRYRVDKGNLRKLGRTYRHGTMFDPKEYLYQKEATMERGGIGSTKETCLNYGGPTAMVPCLHQGNIYI